jgi:hypothetical protein
MNGKEFMTDSQGRLVYIENVRPIDQTRDRLVRDIINKAQELAEIIASTKGTMMTDAKAFVDLSAEEYGIKYGGKKGNITLPTFDGKYKVVIATDDVIIFDERLQVAKALIDEMLLEWSKDAPEELITIITEAFRVDQAGKINQKAILSLRKHKFKDPRWQKAMDAISDSIQTQETREYIRVYQQNESGWEKININSVSA